jgi:hypothetical protein
LVAAKLIPSELGTSLAKMVGFRNIAVHDYRALDLDIEKFGGVRPPASVTSALARYKGIIDSARDMS